MVDIETKSERWLDLENLPNEEWKDIKDFEGLYQISNYGRVKSLERYRNSYSKKVYVPEIIRKNGYDKNGYQILPLNKDSKKYVRKIHRLVAEAFIPNPENKKEIDHLDCNVKNNIFTNLRWVTRLENVRHTMEMGNLYDISKFRKKEVYVSNYENSIK